MEASVPEQGDRRIMKMSDFSDKSREAIRIAAVKALHDRGIRQPTKQQLQAECEQVIHGINGLLREEPTIAILAADYTDSLLARARALRRRRDWQLACVFYALWVEHKINQWISDLARRRSMPTADIDAMIHETQHRAKLSWLLRLLDAPVIGEEHRKSIQQLMDRRNSFVHYKWRQYSLKERRELTDVVNQFEETVKHIKKYEETALGIISTKKAKHMLRRVAD